MKYMAKKYLFILFYLFLFFIIVNELYAGISVTPGVIETVVSREQEVIQNIKVVNTGKFPAIVNIAIDRFAMGDISPSTWLILDPREFELKPGGDKEICCNIKLPKDANGELRARLYVSGKEIGEGSSPIGVRFNMAVYVLIQDTVKLSAEIERINTNYNFKNTEIEGGILLNNKSNAHIRPNIRLVVKDLEGNLVGNINVPFGQPAQKEEKRYFIFKEKMDLNPGKYKIIAEVDYGKFYGHKDLIATKEYEFEVKPELQPG